MIEGRWPRSRLCQTEAKAERRPRYRGHHPGSHARDTRIAARKHPALLPQPDEIDKDPARAAPWNMRIALRKNASGGTEQLPGKTETGQGTGLQSTVRKNRSENTTYQ